MNNLKFHIEIEYAISSPFRRFRSETIYISLYVVSLLLLFLRYGLNLCRKNVKIAAGNILDIFSSQQHFKTLTKTKKNRVRILTNYTTIELSVENLKYNISDIYDLLKYIQQRYPSVLVEVNEKSAEFSNGDKIYFEGDLVLESLEQTIVLDPDSGKLMNKDDPEKKYKYGRFEFLFDFILNKVREVNPEDNLITLGLYI